MCNVVGVAVLQTLNYLTEKVPAGKVEQGGRGAMRNQVEKGLKRVCNCLTVTKLQKGATGDLNATTPTACL